MNTTEGLHFRAATESDLDRCYEIEKSAYTANQAASKAKILKRIQTYPEGFMLLQRSDQILGFISAGACYQVDLAKEEFKALIGHDPLGDKIVIMSVVIDPREQRKGLANAMLKNFISQMKATNKNEIHLICQTSLLPLYEDHGFVDQGVSDSNYGGLSWHEMALILN